MRYYSTSAGEMTLVAGVSAGDTTIVVDTTAGLPVAYPYTLLLDYGQPAEEAVEVTAASGTTLTVTRGVDGTVAQNHALGSKLRHGVTARDFREAREHEESVAAHGVDVVVGTTETQTLENKTFSPGGANAAVVIKTKATNTVGAAEVRTEDGTLVERWVQRGLEFLSGNNVAISLAHAAEAAFTKKLVTLRLENDVNALTGEAQSGATGRFLRLLSGATELFYVSATGALRAVGATFTAAVSIIGNLTVTGNASATGSVTGATLVSTGNASVGGNLAVTGALSGTTITSITGAATTLAGRVTAVETNLGSQTTFAATSAGKDAKRLHWGNKPFGTGDASGYRTITHGAGFTPTSVVVSLDAGFRTGVDNIGASTFRLQIINTDGSANTGLTGNVSYLCGE